MLPLPVRPPEAALTRHPEITCPKAKTTLLAEWDADLALTSCVECSAAERACPLRGTRLPVKDLPAAFALEAARARAPASFETKPVRGQLRAIALHPDL